MNAPTAPVAPTTSTTAAVPTTTPATVTSTADNHRDPASVDPEVELGYLQDIITTHDKHSFTVMALMAATITGLATLAFSWKTNLDPKELLWIGLAANGAFGLWALSHRNVSSKAIKRVRELEVLIRDGGKYAGPWTSHTLAKQGLMNWWLAMSHPTFFLPMLISVVAVCFTYALASGNQKPLTAVDVDRLDAAVVEMAKSQVVFDTQLSVRDGSATATVVVRPQTCTMGIQKANQSLAPWIVTSVDCSAPSRQAGK